VISPEGQSMNVPPIRVLLIEDNASDAAIVRRFLAESATPFAVEVAGLLAEGLDRLGAGAVDVVLLELLLPDSRGLAALSAVQARAPGVPVIVFTGLDNADTAIEALQQGAQDYLVKGVFQGPTLTRAVRHAIERQRLEESLRAAREGLERRVRERTAELARANEGLREREEWLSLAQEAAGIGTFDWDVAADAAKCSARYFALFGLGPGTRPLSREEWLARVHPDDREHCRAEVERALATGGPHLSEYRVLWPDGSVRWLSCSGRVFADAEGRAVRMAGAVMDITERKNAEEALRRSEERLRLALRRMPAILWTTDAELRVTFCAGAGLAALHVDPENVTLGKTVFDYFRTDDRTFYPIAAHCRALAGESVNFEMEWQGAVFQAHLEPLRDGAGRAVGCIGVAVDVSARRRAERGRLELEARVQRAQRLESLGALAGGIAHDFNNLLTEILGYAGLALMDLPADAPASQPVRQIEGAVMRAADLTRQLLAYSGKGMFLVGPVDLSRLVEEMGPLLQGLLPGRALLRCEPLPDLPRPEGDAEQVRQSVLNLVSNAAEALGPAGRGGHAADRGDGRRRGLPRGGRRQRRRAARAVRVPGGRRHGPGDRRGHAAAHFRALLHDQGGGQGTGPARGPGHRPGAPRRPQGHQRTGPRDDGARAVPARRQHGTRMNTASADSRGSVLEIVAAESRNVPDLSARIRRIRVHPRSIRGRLTGRAGAGGGASRWPAGKRVPASAGGPRPRRGR
jgi:PAS domain S-box-containing protein